MRIFFAATKNTRIFFAAFPQDTCLFRVSARSGFKSYRTSVRKQRKYKPMKRMRRFFRQRKICEYFLRQRKICEYFLRQRKICEYFSRLFRKIRIFFASPESKLTKGAPIIGLMQTGPAHFLQRCPWPNPDLKKYFETRSTAGKIFA